MKIRKEFIVGIFASIGIIGLVLGFFFLKGEVVWEEKEEYYAIFPKADGLAPGNKVYLNGISVGGVASVEIFTKDVSKALVKFQIVDPMVKIPKGSSAKLEADLLGTASIALKYKYDSKEFYVKGDTLPTQVQEDLQGEIDKRIQPLMVKMEQLISTADTAITIIHSVFSNNTDNLNETFDGLKDAIVNFESVSEELDSLMFTLSGNRHKITRMLSNIESITGNLKESNEKISTVINNFADISDSVKTMDLVGVVNDAKMALNSANLILDAVYNGDGTITKLMQDSTLYDNLNIMVDEATRLVDNIKDHPNRYLQFAVFGSKDKGINLDSKDEKILKKWVKDTLRDRY